MNAREEQNARSLPTMGQHAGARFGQTMLIQPVPPQPPPHKFPPQQKGNHPFCKFLKIKFVGASARIGQLIRKLGGVAERPIVHQNSVPQHLRVERVPSGSVLSLNKVSINTEKSKISLS
jgi:hypothetical protein